VPAQREHGRADGVAAWAVGIGVGLIALMVTWIVGNRIATVVWDTPVGPTVAFIGAILVGIMATVMAGIRLVRSGRR
jgi:divalent metal cation (Fe/Co/Zn/Cd) transporter